MSPVAPFTLRQILEARTIARAMNNPEHKRILHIIAENFEALAKRSKEGADTQPSQGQ